MKVIKEFIPYVVIILVVVLIRTFLVTPVRVDGSSMYPTLKDGEVLLLEKNNHNYKRNDIVVIDYGNSMTNEKIIKRVIALPGETIEYKENTLYINDKPVNDVVKNITEDFAKTTLGSDEYFVMGDNRKASSDSRIIGVIKKENINGITRLRMFPLKRIGIIKP